MLKKSLDRAVGSCLQGYIDISYDELVEVLGEPNSTGDGEKVDAEWLLSGDDGTVVTIYNYKDGPNYLGREGTLVKNIRDWHIGGNSDRAVDLLIEAFPGALIRKGW